MRVHGLANHSDPSNAIIPPGLLEGLGHCVLTPVLDLEHLRFRASYACPGLGNLTRAGMVVSTKSTVISRQNT
jgi:hypothetical protein